jgi:hypothetical protein
VQLKSGIRPDEVKGQAQHMLFVEGKDSDSIDPSVLSELFKNQIGIKALGSCYSVRSAAEALSYNPKYYFLIDRDHLENDLVEEYWNSFSSRENNLLVWRRRQIENYFIEPEYLSRSKYCEVNKEKLKEEILKYANERLFLDVVNYVIISIREELKNNWIELCRNPEEFSDSRTALEKLKNISNFNEYRSKVDRVIASAELETLFNKYLEMMTAGQQSLTFEAGIWINMINGKKILNQVIHSNFFKVKNNDGIALTGNDKTNEVLKDLLRQDDLPSDFLELKQLIIARIDEKY